MVLFSKSDRWVNAVSVSKIYMFHYMEYKITNSCHKGVPTHINQGSNELVKVVHSGWVPGSPLCSSTPQPKISSDKDGHSYMYLTCTEGH